MKTIDLHRQLRIGKHRTLWRRIYYRLFPSRDPMVQFLMREAAKREAAAIERRFAMGRSYGEPEGILDSASKASAP